MLTNSIYQEIQACPANVDVVVRKGMEKECGVLRRHCRNGNKPVVIFQGVNILGEERMTINWADGTFCYMPDTPAMWWLLLTIKAFEGVDVAYGDSVRWQLTSEALSRAEDGLASVTRKASTLVA